MVGVRVPGSERLLFPKLPERPWGPCSSYPMTEGVRWRKGGAESWLSCFEVYNAWRFTSTLFHTPSWRGAYVQEGHSCRNRDIVWMCGRDWINSEWFHLANMMTDTIKTKKLLILWASISFHGRSCTMEFSECTSRNIYISPRDSYCNTACFVYWPRQDTYIYIYIYIYRWNPSVLLYLHSE
jgi:hypothetical protein